MSRVKAGAVLIGLALGFAAAGWTQGMRGGMGRQAPGLFGAFKPVLGAGAQYQLILKDRTLHYVFAIVGQEDVEGSTGYWLETRTESPDTPGEMLTKQLMVLGGDRPQIKRRIIQQPGRPPMEMPMGMMPGMEQREPSTSGGDTRPGEKVSTETITVPAGTFECEHYHRLGPQGPVDIWLSSNISPYGTVKMVSGEMTMLLEKILSNETSHIQGEPQKMNFPMPRP